MINGIKLTKEERIQELEYITNKQDKEIKALNSKLHSYKCLNNMLSKQNYNLNKRIKEMELKIAEVDCKQLVLF